MLILPLNFIGEQDCGHMIGLLIIDTIRHAYYSSGNPVPMASTGYNNNGPIYPQFDYDLTCPAFYEGRVIRWWELG